MNFNVYARHPETGLLTTYQIPEDEFAAWLCDMQDAGYVCGVMSVTPVAPDGAE